jgi:sugar lactone lactonase YvrE
MLLVLAVTFGTVHGVSAQGVSFNGIQTAVATGFNAPNGVVLDGRGNAYVADANNGRVWKLKASANGVSCPAAGSCISVGTGFQQPTAVALDSSQNLYVADYPAAQVVRVAPDGTQTVMATNVAYTTGVAVDNRGNLYVGSGIGIVWVPAGGTRQTYTYGLTQAAGVAVDANRNLYVADKGTNQLVMIPPITRSVIVLATGLNSPSGVALDGNGMVYVADSNNNRILRIPATSSGLDCSIAGNCTAVANNPTKPAGLAVDGSGNIFFTGSNQLSKSSLDVDFGSSAVATATPASQTLLYTLPGTTCGAASTVNVLTQGAANKDFTLSAAGTCTPGTPSAFSATINLTPQLAGLRPGAVQLVDGSGHVTATTYLHGVGVGPQIAWTSGALSSVASALTAPLSVAVDGGGNTYIADAGLSSILKVPLGCSSMACTLSVGSGLAQPNGVAVDASGNVYVALSGSNSLVQVPWNASTSSYGAAVTLASGLSLNAASPAGVAVDAAGNVYLADTDNQRVVKVPFNAGANAFGPLSTVLSGGVLSAPTGVAVDGSGNVYIADASAQKVLEVAIDGTQTTLASSVNASGVAVDGSGDVYYTDQTANTVTKLPWTGTSFGTASTLIASGLSGAYALAVDANGSVYVVNNTALTVSKLDATTPPTLSFAATKVAATSTDSPRKATLANIGNAALTFPVLASTNPSIAAGFVIDNATTCPQVYTTSSAQTLAQGSSCGYAVDFTPTGTNIGSNSGALIATDSNLNAMYTTQTLALNGTGIADDTSSVTVGFTPMSPVTFGQAVSIAATVRDTTVPATTPTGNVTFTDTDSASHTSSFGGTVALSSGVATVAAYTPASVGSHTITANYSGAVGNIAAGSGSSVLVVNKATPTLTYAPSPATQGYGTAIAATALNAKAVDLNGNTVAGTFIYTTLVGNTATILVAGTTILPVGTYTLTATFTPTDTADYVSGGTRTASYTVTQGTATVSLGNLSQTYNGSGHSATATTTPTGLSVAITYNGSATLPVGAGSYAVVATVNDSNYTGSASGTLTIAKAAPAVALSVSANPVLTQGSVTLTATVSASSTTPTGSVIFMDGTAALGSVALSSGVATLQTTFQTVGTHSITAVYSGDTNNSSATSSALTENVQDFTLAIASGSGGVSSVTVSAGATATYLFTVTPTGGTTLPAPVAMSVSGLPSGAVTTFTPSTVASGSAATNVTLTIQAPKTAALLQHEWPMGNGLAPISLGLLLLPFAWRFRRSARRMRSLTSLALLAIAGTGMLVGLAGCGSGGTTTTTTTAPAPTTYTVTVTATTGTLAHATTVTLIVN